MEHDIDGWVNKAFLRCPCSFSNETQLTASQRQPTTKTKHFKNEEAEILKSFISANRLWIDFIPETSYIGEGAEQKIYEATDPQHIIKLNDTIFYESWLDYFHSLLLHNFFFPHLAYELIGFHYDEKLFAVVKQAYVKSTQATNLENVREFLAANGFIRTKINDYYNPQLGIILEDLHDENVLTEEGVLQFIDTVFFLTPAFFDKTNDK